MGARVRTILLTTLVGALVAAAAAAGRLNDDDDDRMVVEVRTYTLKPQTRDRFVRAFEERAVPALEAAGIRVIGSFVSTEDDRTFVWLRGFRNEEDRVEKIRAFYSSEAWRAMAGEFVPLIAEDGIDVKVVTPTPGSAIRW